MKRRQKLLLPFGLLFLFVWPSISEGRNHPICVVGGGISGLVVAHVLSDKLKACPCYNETHVRLFEKSPDHFGGKLDTAFSSGNMDDDIPDMTYQNVWEKGPIIFTKEDALLLKYLKKYDMYEGLVTWECRNFAAFDPDSDATIMMEDLVPANAVDPLTAAIQKYQKI